MWSFWRPEARWALRSSAGPHAAAPSTRKPIQRPDTEESRLSFHPTSGSPDPHLGLEFPKWHWILCPSVCFQIPWGKTVSRATPVSSTLASLKGTRNPPCLVGDDSGDWMGPPQLTCPPSQCPGSHKPQEQPREKRARGVPSPRGDSQGMGIPWLNQESPSRAMTR